MVLPLHLLHPIILLLCCTANSLTFADQVAALLSFKSLLSDPANALSSWNSQTAQVCMWHGVRCRDGLNVTSLQLDSLGLAGPISPAIANLSSLRHLHLAGNQFNGSIPSELSNLARLRYFNLSYNALVGALPGFLSCSRLRIISLDNNKLEGEITATLKRCSRLRVISLRNNNLSGKIPGELGALLELQWLYLNGNKFSGSLPATFGSINTSQITEIMLSNNSLTGEIPDSLGNLASLTLLDLYGNNFAGRIPPSLGNCSNLSYLDLSINSLEGSIPESLGQLTNLRVLYLSINSLEGSIPESLGQLTNLRVLDLSTNKLSGLIPSPLYNLSSLTILNLEINQLQGTLRPDIGNALPRLTYLLLQSNGLTGSMPATIANASGLLYLDLDYNNFNGTIPTNLGQLSNLAWLGLCGNRFKATGAEDWKFVDALANCTGLKHFVLSNNDFGGNFPYSLVNLSPRLEWLSLGELQITGAIPSDIKKLQGLQQLDLHQNLLTGNIPSSIGSLVNLTRLYMFGNKFSGEIPASMANLARLEVLHLGDNALHGRVPQNFEGFKNLIELNLSHNQLNGTIPREVLSISSLSTVLDLSHNSFSGSIPSEVEKLKLLLLLDISENKLSGPIPVALGICESMNSLFMKGNLFVGAIPSELKKLTSLQRLDLSRNKLSGQIPEFLAGITTMQYLNLSINDLEGPVPMGGAFANKSEAFLNGNPKLCGGSPVLSLPPCSVQSSKHKEGIHGSLKIVMLTIGSLIICFAVLSIATLLWKKAPSQKPSTLISSFSKDQFRLVSYAELHQATDGFSSANLIGTGSFSCVYRGTLDRYQSCVAIKVFNLAQKGAIKSYMAECEALRSIRHRNLVKILTCCSTIDHQGNDFKALVLEFVPNRSLRDWLHPGVSSSCEMKHLSLAQRLDIATDVACALEYLHHRHGQTPIVHCDVKPSNILLDDNMCARLGDFGLTKFLCAGDISATSGDPSYSIALKGSVGYIPPEYGTGGAVSTHGDVYSYGILVLEMVTGKRPTDEMFDGGRSIRSLAEEAAFAGRATQVVDPLLLSDEEDDGHKKSMSKCLTSMIEIGLLCSKEAPRDRMDMVSVVAEMAAVRSAYLGLGWKIASLVDRPPSSSSSMSSHERNSNHDGD